MSEAGTIRRLGAQGWAIGGRIEQFFGEAEPEAREHRRWTHSDAAWHGRILEGFSGAGCG